VLLFDKDKKLIVMANIADKLVESAWRPIVFSTEIKSIAAELTMTRV
jgi:hypothetical protein